MARRSHFGVVAQALACDFLVHATGNHRLKPVPVQDCRGGTRNEVGGSIPSPIPGVLSRARAEDLERFYVASLSIVVIRSLPIFRARLGKPSVGDFIREAIKLEY